MAKANGIDGLPSGKSERNDNTVKFIGRTIYDNGAVKYNWPRHCADTGNHSAKVVADAGPNGITFGNYIAAKGSVSRLVHMVQKGVVKVALTGDTTPVNARDILAEAEKAIAATPVATPVATLLRPIGGNLVKVLTPDEIKAYAATTQGVKQ